MDRRRMPWLLAFPLMVAGSLTAHLIGQRLFAPGSAGAEPRTSTESAIEVVGRSSHGPNTLIPVLVGVAIAMLLTRAGARLIGGRRSTPPVWFLVLPPLAYVAQEIAERLLHAESFALNPAHEPAFFAALLLQLPFGWLAYRLARALRDIARRAIAVVARAWQRRRIPVPPTLAAPAPLVVAVRSLALARGQPSRAPPLPA